LLFQRFILCRDGASPSPFALILVCHTFEPHLALSSGIAYDVLASQSSL
jgi:hypothetical protein